jgi:hypothetical protein
MKIIKIFLLFLLLPNILLAKETVPKWFSNPKQNDSQNLYGTASANTLEEATKYSLVDLASRLIVSISAESQLSREENQQGFNEEMRQKVQQSIEKISFSNYQITKSIQEDQKFFVEVSVEKESFINEQQDRAQFLQKKINDLDKILPSANFLQKHIVLNKIIPLVQELELKTRILNGAGAKANLSDVLDMLAKYQNELNQSTFSAEFYFDKSSNNKLNNVIKAFLNKDGFTISNVEKNTSPQQIKLIADYISDYNFLYNTHIVKIKISFENIVQNKIIASNSLELTGNSSISKEEAINAALQILQQQIEKNGILNILGIINNKN